MDHCGIDCRTMDEVYGRFIRAAMHRQRTSRNTQSRRATEEAATDTRAAQRGGGRKLELTARPEAAAGGGNGGGDLVRHHCAQGGAAAGGGVVVVPMCPTPSPVAAGDSDLGGTPPPQPLPLSSPHATAAPSNSPIRFTASRKPSGLSLALGAHGSASAKNAQHAMPRAALQLPQQPPSFSGGGGGGLGTSDKSMSLPLAYPESEAGASLVLLPFSEGKVHLVEDTHSTDTS